MADITATAREPMKSGQLHKATRVWASALALALSLSACGGSATDSAQAKGAASTQLSSTGSTDSTLATGTALSSAELAAAEKAAVVAEASGSSTSLDELKPGQIAAKSAYVSGAVVRKAAAVRIPVYRFSNSATGAHFFTTSTTERDNLIATMSPPFRHEGVAFHVASDFSPGFSPVHRFLNTQTGVHFYTISESERVNVVASMPQFQYEGVAYHASQVAGKGLIPFYRFLVPSKGFHFYTANEAEKDSIIANLAATYRFEGIGYYVLDTNWTAERLPHTGVTSSQCYQAGSSAFVACSDSAATGLNSLQDGHRSAINAMSYSPVPGHPLTNCVKDNITGLIWEGKTDDGGLRDKDKTYTNLGGGALTDTSGYVAAVNDTNLCGFNDWRLPTRQELLGLVDYSKDAGAAFNTSVFTNTAPGLHWSADIDSDNSTQAWYVSWALGGGYSFTAARTASHAVSLVRGSAISGPRFSFSTVAYSATGQTDGADNVVDDAWTGLQWRRCEEGRVWSGSTCTGSASALTHEQALAHARSQSGWRLPNAKELASLVDLSVSGATARVDTTAFPEGTASFTWSSSPFALSSSNAWGVDFFRGAVGTNVNGRNGTDAVRLVRSSP